MGCTIPPRAGAVSRGTARGEGEGSGSACSLPLDGLASYGWVIIFMNERAIYAISLVGIECGVMRGLSCAVGMEPPSEGIIS